MSTPKLALFKCHREVHAAPMSLHEFSELTGKTFDPHVGNSDGYLVVYNQGTDTEYRSWAAKDQFEQSYSKVTD